MPDYDLMVHLVGEQAIPNLIAMRQLDVPRHLLLVSDQTLPVAKRLAQLQPGACRWGKLRNPYAIGGTSAQTLQFVRSMGARQPVFNLTGGTKMMFAGAYDAAQQLNAPCFYVETVPNRTLHWLEPHRKVPLKPVLGVEDFVRVVGHDLQDPGRWESDPLRATRVELCRRFWDVRSKICEGNRQKAFAAFCKDSSAGKSLPPFPAGIMVAGDPSGRWTLTLGGATGQFSSADEVAAFMAGGWFEEFCYSLLRPLEMSGLIHQLRFRLKPAWGAQAAVAADAQGIQEFDLAFTDGFRLFVLECKAGDVKQEHIQVLENNRNSFGGAMGQGLLLTTFPLRGAAARRIQGSKLAAIGGGALPDALSRGDIITLPPGAVLPRRRSG